MKIKDIPFSERPRERLINSGANYLSNEELLAILINTGSMGLSAKELASNLISKVADISLLKDLSINQITSVKGLGIKKATTLIAAFEIGKRLNQKTMIINDLKVNSAEMVYNYYYLKLKDKKQEHFYCLFLDNNKRIIKEKLLFIGTLNFSVVHPREIFKEAYLVSASSIICVHNHPSGEVTPSTEDKNLTNRLKEIGELLGIKIVDHIIIGNNYFSFYENQLI